jgi:hypothetical protein
MVLRHRLSRSHFLESPLITRKTPCVRYKANLLLNYMKLNPRLTIVRETPRRRLCILTPTSELTIDIA